MTYVTHLLAEQYIELGEDQRLHSLQEMLAFSRRPGELTDQLISRFGSVRMHAAQQ